MKKQLYAVILAGGKGERLWPLSRTHTPKQVLEIKPGVSLVQATIDRIKPIVPKDHRFILTTQQQQEIISQSILKHDAQILVEPATKNTAPAVLYASLTIMEHDPDAVIIFLPADHFIIEEQCFQEALQNAFNWVVTHNDICLLGVKPSWAATGYGYIEFQPNASDEIYKVLRFHEKPNTQTAQMYLSLPSMLWNIGVFCARAKTFVEQFSLHQESLLNHMKEYIDTRNSVIYDALKAQSFDYAILEKSTQVHVIPLNVTWSDIGNVYEFLRLSKHYKQDDVFEFEAEHNLVYKTNRKLVALIGVHNICVIETDDALLVVKQDDVEKVKNIVALLKEHNVLCI